MSHRGETRLKAPVIKDLPRAGTELTKNRRRKPAEAGMSSTPAFTPLTPDSLIVLVKRPLPSTLLMGAFLNRHL
jgi:hypothetical protein